MAGRWFTTVATVAGASPGGGLGGPASPDVSLPSETTMDRRVNAWVKLGAIAGLGLVSLILAIVTLSEAATSGGGDLLVSPSMASGMDLAVLVGAAIILGLELAHMKSRRIRRARVVSLRPAARAWLP